MKPFLALGLLVVTLALPTPAWPVIEGDPIFAGIWSRKDPGGAGSLYLDMGWEGLVTRWKDLGRQNQYLTDVEVYRRNGEWRYAAVWRAGTGNGALLLAPWADFLKTWTELKDTQELIDLEIVQDGTVRKFLGVWQHKPPARRANPASGALFVGLTWDQLVAKHTDLASEQYLADLETYVDDGKRLFAGVWRVGPGNGALYGFDDWAKFLEQKARLDATQEMLQFRMFQTEDGRWSFLGVWRVSPRSGPIDASSSDTAFKPLTPEQFVASWQKRSTAATLTGLAVANPFTALRGDTTCKYGDPDCNRCATGVADQFKLAFEGGHRPWVGWRQGSWSFHGNDRYPPDDRKPEDAFYPYGEGKQVGVVSKHVQGLVRTNSSRFPLAGSHSHRDVGSLFVVENRQGDLSLQSLYRAAVSHPSGVAVLGDGVFVVESGSLRWIRVSDAGKKQTQRYELDELGTGGGGLGLAKLHDGSTLLIVTTPGDGFRKGTTEKQREQNLNERTTRFYRLAPSAFHSHPVGTKPFGRWSHVRDLEARPDKPMAYSENLSVVTECETGRIYTIHSTGDYGLYGDGYWRLARVEDSPHGPQVVHVQIARQDQHTEKCHHRSSATVHVSPEGMLEFLCTERAVIKWNPKGSFTFTEGTR